MQITVYNSKQLDVVMRDMLNKFDSFKSLAISYDKPFKDKTLKQLGYIFGGLIDSVIDFYAEQGIKWTQDDVKENFYQACSKLDESLVKVVRRFNGDVYQVPKRLSEMSLEEASLFIDKCLYLIDHAKPFKDLILHPSLRYTWIRHISDLDMLQIKDCKLPRNCPEYLEHTRKQACLCCGRMNCSEVHHLKLMGETGTGYKADDWLTIPLCRECHIEDLHQHGQQSFYKNFDWITKYVSLTDFCRIRYLRWLNKL